MAAKKKAGSRCRTLWVAVLFLASISALIAVAVIQTKWTVQVYEYGIVIDSGSSRSTIYLYRWPADKQNDTGVVAEVTNCRVAGKGISDMRVDQEQDKVIWAGFKACLANISREIPPEKHKKTPLFLGATAGMRMLDMEDRNRSEEVIIGLKQYLTSQPFKFQDAVTLTGQDEGLYGWVTVNYLMGNFLEKNAWNAFVRPTGASTMGSMDLGGASTQLAFEVDDQLKGEDYLSLQLYGYNYTVYTHSYLCYGKNEAEKQILDRIIKAAPDPTNIENPCYQEGFKMSMNAKDLYDSPCTEKPKNFDPNMVFNFYGKPDTDRCLGLVRTLFDFRNCTAQGCSFNGVEQPPVRGDFMAYAGFFFVAKSLRLNGTSMLENFNNTLRNFCNTPAEELRASREEISERHLRTYCYSGHYVFTMLVDGYKFSPETWEHIAFEREVKGTSLGWSLGYMLHMSNMIPAEPKEILPMSSPLFTGLVFLFSALMIVTLVFLFIMLIRTCY